MSESDKSLTADEIAELQLNITNRVFPVGYVQTVMFQAETASALLTMASRLIELESALAFLDGGEGKRGTHGSDMRADALIVLAKGLGWEPPSQVKGGG